jgi:hypothetical protein
MKGNLKLNVDRDNFELLCSSVDMFGIFNIDME